MWTAVEAVGLSIMTDAACLAKNPEKGLDKQTCAQTLCCRVLTCGVGVAALDILEGAAAVDDEVFSPSAEVDEVQGAEEESLYDKVPVTDGIHGVRANPTKEAQLLCNELPVNSKRVACQCTCKHTVTILLAPHVHLAYRHKCCM